MISSPLDLPYVKALIFSLSIIGAWPHDRMGTKMWFFNTKGSNAKVLILIYAASVVLGVKYIMKNYDVMNILDLSSLIVHVLGNCISFQRKTVPLTTMYKKLTRDFFNKVHLFHHKHKNDFAMKMYTRVSKILTIITVIHVGEIYYGSLMNNLTPLYNSYRRGMFKAAKPENSTYDHIFFYDLPFDYHKNFYGFLIIYIFNAFITYDCANSLCAIDLYLFIIVLNLWAHLKVLKHNLMTFPKPQYSDGSFMYDEEESRNITSLLTESMDHYRFIMKFIDELSMAYGLTICIYLIFHQIIQCMLLLQLSEMTADSFMMFGIMCFFSFQQLIQFAVYFELLRSQIETTKDAVYEVPWEFMDTNNRKIVLAYLMYTQKPVEINALGLVPVGVRTVVSIFKTTMSYYMLLRTL